MMRFAIVYWSVLFLSYQDINGKFIVSFFDLQLKQRFRIGDKTF